MSEVDEPRSPAAAAHVQRFRFRVVAPDGRELVSDVVQVQVQVPAPPPRRIAAPRATPAKAAPQEPLSAVQPGGAAQPLAGRAPGQPLAAVASAEPLAAPAVSQEKPAETPVEDPFRVKSILVSVEGTKQGKFKTETQRKDYPDRFDALALDYRVATPVDAATGHNAGKRRHEPLSLTKEWGASTPQLFQAMVTNEVLKSVEIDCFGVDKGGAEKVVHKVKLTNATVASIQQRTGAAIHDPTGRPYRALETVAFCFEKIEHTTPKDAVVASDQLR